jgi:hypothetical protein
MYSLKVYDFYNKLAERIGGKHGWLSGILVKAGYSKSFTEEITIGEDVEGNPEMVWDNVIYHNYIKKQSKLPSPENICSSSGTRISIKQSVFHHEFMISLMHGIFFPRGFLITDVNGRFVREVSHFPNLALQQHPNFKDAILPKVRRLKGIAIVLRSGVHYHTLQEGLLGLFLYRALGFNISAINHFIIFNVGNAFTENIAEALDVPESKIITCSHHTGVGFSADTLIVPSYFNRLGNWYQTFLQGYIKKNSAEITTTTRVFITRGNSLKRKLINENELLPILISFGFKIIDNNLLTFKEQITWFSNASFVVGVHGSNLANILFCKPETKIIEIRHNRMKSYLSDCYYKMAVSNNMHYNVFFDDSSTTEKDPHLYVDPKIFSEFLRQVLDC